MILFESNFCSVCISRHPKYPNDKIYPDNKKIKHYFTVNDAQRSYILKQSFVNLPTVLDHWGVGLHWGYCLGNFSWVQWVLRLSLYTASMPWGQGVAWLSTWVTSTRRQHSGARDPAMAGISSRGLWGREITGDHSLTLCCLCRLLLHGYLATGHHSTRHPAPDWAWVCPGVHTPQLGLSVAAHSLLARSSRLAVTGSPCHGMESLVTAHMRPLLSLQITFILSGPYSASALPFPNY